MFSEDSDWGFSILDDSLFSEDASSGVFGEIPNGDLSAASTGERGGGGGGGSLILTERSLFLDLSSNDRLLKRCSKNLDLVLPPSFYFQTKGETVSDDAYAITVIRM